MIINHRLSSFRARYSLHLTIAWSLKLTLTSHRTLLATRLIPRDTCEGHLRSYTANANRLLTIATAARSARSLPLSSMTTPRFALREHLSRKEVALGAWQVIPSTLVSRLLSGSSPDLSVCVSFIVPARGSLLSISGFWLMQSTGSLTVSFLSGRSAALRTCIDRAPDTHLYDLANAIASQGLSPIVRVPIDQDWWIKRKYSAVRQTSC